MDKKVINILIGVGLGITALTIIGAVTTSIVAKKKVAKAGDDKEDTGANTNTGPSSVPANDSFPLKKGSKGENVKKLQRWLRVRLNAISNDTTREMTTRDYAQGLYGNMDIDGIFGQNTEDGLYFLLNERNIGNLEFLTKGMILYTTDN